MNLTNRVYTHDAADSLEYRGQAYCLLCLHHYRLIVDPDTEYHQRVYHVELAAGIIKNLETHTVTQPPINFVVGKST